MVYAKKRDSKKEFAIKFIKCDFGSTLALRNIIREISILRQFGSSNRNFCVTKLYDVILAVKPDQPISEAKGVFLVLKYKPNDLKQMITDIDPADLKEAHVKIIVYNMLCSLNFIHTAGIMHRDIKPANVLIDDQCQITLCDFGLARTMVKEIKSNRQKLEEPKRRLSTHISSRWYRSPEIILTQEFYDSKIDIWALGCIMAELLLKIEKEYTAKHKSDYSDRFLFPG